MAYMMSDMAAGSTAALQMQKNMAAAPYVQQETAAAAEETQLKLQQDRLKAQYAPQEMAIKMQEDEAILQKNIQRDFSMLELQNKIYWVLQQGWLLMGRFQLPLLLQFLLLAKLLIK